MRVLYLYKLYCSNALLFLFFFFIWYSSGILFKSISIQESSACGRHRRPRSSLLWRILAAKAAAHSSINTSFGSRIFFSVFEQIRRPTVRAENRLFYANTLNMYNIRHTRPSGEIRYKMSRRTGRVIIIIIFPDVHGGNRHDINYFTLILFGGSRSGRPVHVLSSFGFSAWHVVLVRFIPGIGRKISTAPQAPPDTGTFDNIFSLIIIIIISVLLYDSRFLSGNGHFSHVRTKLCPLTTPE